MDEQTGAPIPSQGVDAEAAAQQPTGEVFGNAAGSVE
jgi:hypothetical protein